MLPSQMRKVFLLLASCYFYMALLPKYIVILIVVITVDYFLAFLIDRHEGKKRTIFLVCSIVTNIGILFFFKYFNFFNVNIASLATALHFNYSPMLLHVILPLGLSFHVFQSLSYVIEVYRKKYSPEKNYLTYALYVMFFPQLVAGPIERPANLLPQLSSAHVFNPVVARKGLERMLWGFFKKLVIADQIAQIINPLFANPQAHGPIFVIMAIFFTYQLYCDFSGYTDIALGTAMMFGYTLRENFNRPFAAESFSDFWRRWHMSLSTWFRDYVYFSLGGSKVSKIKWIRNTLIVFLLSGFWHGANWTFIVWGGINGLYLIIESMTKTAREWCIRITNLSTASYLYKGLSTIFVFSCIAISFVFFRAETVGQAMWILSHFFVDWNTDFIMHHLMPMLTKVSGNSMFLVTILSIFCMEGVQYYQEKENTFYIFDTKSKALRYGWYYFLTCSIIVFGYFQSQSFIYFQF
jgi:D-alanyl-lipoteichoic acid acyltransferase DltB (MBOAT superfamily)